MFYLNTKALEKSGKIYFPHPSYDEINQNA